MEILSTSSSKEIYIDIWNTDSTNLFFQGDSFRYLKYRILLNKRTVQVEFGKIFYRRGVVKYLYNCTPQLLPIGVQWPLLHLRTLAVQHALKRCLPQQSTRKKIRWSIVRSCGEYERWEREGTAEMALFSAGLQTRQEERYVFWLLLGEI